MDARNVNFLISLRCPDFCIMIIFYNRKTLNKFGPNNLFSKVVWMFPITRFLLAEEKVNDLNHLSTLNFTKEFIVMSLS